MYKVLLFLVLIISLSSCFIAISFNKELIADNDVSLSYKNFCECEHFINSNKAKVKFSDIELTLSQPKSKEVIIPLLIINFLFVFDKNNDSSLISINLAEYNKTDKIKILSMWIETIDDSIFLLPNSYLFPKYSLGKNNYIVKDSSEIFKCNVESAFFIDADRFMCIADKNIYYELKKTLKMKMPIENLKKEKTIIFGLQYELISGNVKCVKTIKKRLRNKKVNLFFGGIWDFV